MQIKRIYEVLFHLVVHEDHLTDDSEVEHGDFEDSEDSVEAITAMLLCGEELSLAEFAQRCEADKLSILHQLGYADIEADEIQLVSVENVSEVNVAFLPSPTQH